MAHEGQREFVEAVKKQFPSYFINQDVAEIGSLNINGSIRDVFEGCRYTGFDVAEGAGVDRVIQGQLVGDPTHSFDVTISCECFEHNPFWVETFANMLRMTRDGGLVIFSCATTGRPEHGTRRSDIYSAPLSEQVGWQDYYKNLTSDDFLKTFNLKGWFGGFQFLLNANSFDLCFFGIKHGGAIEYSDLFSVLENCINSNIHHVYGWLQKTGDAVMVRGEGSNVVLWSDFK